MDAATQYVARLSDQRSDTGSTIYNRLYAELGLNAIYLQFGGVAPEAFCSALRALDFRGATVVGSYSRSVLPFLDGLDQHAESVGAVNSLVYADGGLNGYKTDGPALVDSLAEITEIQGKAIVIVGAGKLAREFGIVLGARGLSPKSVDVFNRTRAKADALAAEFGWNAHELADVEGSEGDILMNVSDLGASWCETAWDWPQDLVARFDAVVDVTFRPLTSRLVEDAKRLGKAVVDGADMFTRQGARQVELYLGVSPEKARLRQLVLEELG